jgi:hypothetical protein
MGCQKLWIAVCVWDIYNWFFSHASVCITFFSHSYLSIELNILWHAERKMLCMHAYSYASRKRYDGRKGASRHINGMYIGSVYRRLFSLHSSLCICLKDVVAVWAHAYGCWMSYARKKRLHRSEIVLSCVYMRHIKWFFCPYTCLFLCYLTQLSHTIILLPFMTCSP